LYGNRAGNEITKPCLDSILLKGGYNMSNLLKDVAYSLGVQAFKNNKKRIPAHDKELLENCVAGCQVGESIPYFEAWLLGWDHANLGYHE
jgi:hypothetical protein